MKQINRWLIIVLVIIGLGISACGAESTPPKKIEPATLEEIEGSELKRVILTEKAAERIDLQTVPAEGTMVPYAAVIYDIEGNTWVYTNPAPLTFVRAAIEIDHIEGDQAFLAQPLESNDPIVTVGVAEIYGAETGVSK
jgi:hypothetical protein